MRKRARKGVRKKEAEGEAKGDKEGTKRRKRRREKCAREGGGRGKEGTRKGENEKSGNLGKWELKRGKAGVKAW